MDGIDLAAVLAWTRRVLDTTLPLARGPNSYASSTSKFPRVLESTFRRDYFTLAAIEYLADGQVAGRGYFGTCCMDLSRRVVEDLISIEFMLLKGKDEMAQKFIDFFPVEVKRGKDFLAEVQVSLGPEFEQDIDERFEAVRSRFEDSKGRPRKSWAGLDIESMMGQLRDAGVIPVSQFGPVLHTYLIGNYKNHFSPSDVLRFASTEAFEKTEQQDLSFSLAVAASSVARMAWRLVAELQVSDANRDAISQLWADAMARLLTEGSGPG